MKLLDFLRQVRLSLYDDVSTRAYYNLEVVRATSVGTYLQ